MRATDIPVLIRVASARHSHQRSPVESLCNIEEFQDNMFSLSYVAEARGGGSGAVFPAQHGPGLHGQTSV